MAEFPIQVLSRMTVEQAKRLDEVRAMKPALTGRAAAVRRLIDALGDDDIAQSATDAAEGKEVVLHRDDVVAVLSALQERTRAYSDLARQVHAIGNNFNQLTKLGHQIVSYGYDGVIPVEAVGAIDRQLDGIYMKLSIMAIQDQSVEAVVRACQP